jgi:hypothetical protein
LDLRRYKIPFGDTDHLKVLANVDAAEIWFAKHDPEGVAFEFDVIETEPP